MRTRWKIAQKAELIWWKNYLKKKDKTSYLKWKKNYWDQFLLKLGIEVKDGSTTLDAGCGPAGIFISLGNTQCTATDPLLNSYLENLEVLDANDYPYVAFRNESLEDLNEQEKYDLIFCLNAINHVSDWKKSQQNLWNALKPGAQLVLSSDVHRFPGLRYPFRLFQGDILHPHQHSLKEYEAFFKTELPNAKLLKSVLYKKDGLFNYYVFLLEKGISE